MYGNHMVIILTLILRTGAWRLHLPQVTHLFICFQVALKCADLGHLASEDRVHRKWVAALEEEMFRQGDLEKARGHPSVSPLMDRDKGGITKSQPGVSQYLGDAGEAW